jgi:hypothetical protein
LEQFAKIVSDLLDRIDLGGPMRMVRETPRRPARPPRSQGNSIEIDYRVVSERHRGARLATQGTQSHRNDAQLRVKKRYCAH